MKKKKTKRRAAKRPRAKTTTQPKPEKTAAIVRIEPAPRALVASGVTMALVAKVKETVADLEQVRRFVRDGMNIELRQWLEKHPFQETWSDDQKKAWDEKRISLERDWGTITGEDKPFLKQPGAEKVLFWLQIYPKYHKTRTELGDGHFEMVAYATFHLKAPPHEEVFEGPECSCTTMETNFRFMWAEKKDPCTCGTFPCQGCAGGPRKEDLKAVKMGKSIRVNEYKKGRIVGKRWAWFERVTNPNIWNERNKVGQQGQKRCLVKGVRNMGALSEVFSQPPDEWDIPEDREDTPENDMDYTEGGREIYVDGKSPSGRSIDPKAAYVRKPTWGPSPEESKARGTWCAKHQCDIYYCPSEEHTGAENDAAVELIHKFRESYIPSRKSSVTGGGNGQAGAPNAASRQQANTTSPADRPSNPAGEASATVGKIIVDFWIDPDTPAVRGDISNLTAQLQQHCEAVWAGDWWKIPPQHLDTVVAMAKQLGYAFEIIQPPTTTKYKAEKPAAKAKKGPRKGTPGEHIIEGVIEKAIPKEGRSPRIDFLVKTDKGSFWMSCYSKTWFGILGKERYPCPVMLIVKTTINEGKNQTYRNILRAVRIRDDEYDEHGKKIIQQNTREAGGRTLFG